MAKQTKSTRTTRSSGLSLSKFSFWIVIIIGIAMAVSGFLNFFNWDWVYKFSAWVQAICFALGMFVPLVESFRHARNRNTGWFVLWLVCAILLAFGLISTLVGLVF